jgi:hypothetical protein
MLPHEKELVKRLQDQPFALLGINSDMPEDPALESRPFEQQLETVRKHVKQNIVDKLGLTWRNAIACGTEGPLPTRWNVDAWPTLYVIDAAGKIRYKGHNGTAMELCVDRCLGELTPKPAPKKQ